MPVFPDVYKKYCDRKLKIITNYLKKDDKILDAGCGDKSHPYVFSYLLKNYDTKGIDLDNSWNENIIKGDISKMDFADNSFDVVLCLDVLEHIENWQKVFSELLRVAKRKVIISVPTTENKIFFTTNQFLRKLIGINNILFAGHFRDYFPKQITELANQKGFFCQLFKVKFATPFFSPLLLYTKLRYGGIFIIDKKENHNV